MSGGWRARAARLGSCPGSPVGGPGRPDARGRPTPEAAAPGRRRRALAGTARGTPRPRLPAPQPASVARPRAPARRAPTAPLPSLRPSPRLPSPSACLSPRRQARSSWWLPTREGTPLSVHADPQHPVISPPALAAASGAHARGGPIPTKRSAERSTARDRRDERRHDKHGSAGEVRRGSTTSRAGPGRVRSRRSATPTKRQLCAATGVAGPAVVQVRLHVDPYPPHSSSGFGHGAGVARGAENDDHEAETRRIQKS